MGKKDVTTVGDAMAKKYPYTAEDIANQFEMNPDSFRVWKSKLEKSGKIAKPQIPSLFCIQDPESKNRLLYSEEYLKKIQELRAKTPRRVRGGKMELTRKASLKSAIMTILVPIHDENIVAYIKRKFKDEGGIEKHLRNHIKDLAVPALSKIEELKRRHAKELEDAFANL